MTKKLLERAERPSGLTGITSSQRAAVVIAMLGETAAKPIVERLDDDALAKVARGLESISFLDHAELAEVVIDFIIHLRKSEGALRGGPSRSREIISGVLEPGRLNMLFGGPAEESDEPAAPSQNDVWSRVQEKDPEQLATYLAGLSPNLISIVLRKLDVSVSSDVLCFMEDDKVRPTLGYLVNADETDDAINSVVERMIEMEFLNAEQETSEEDAAHLESVGELLSLLPSVKRDGLVDFLKTEHEAKLEGIQQSMFTIEGLPELLPRASVPVVFKEIEGPEMLKLLTSLSGEQQAVQDYLLGNISSRMADQIRDDLSDAEAPGQDEIDGIYRDFLSKLMSLKRRGLITLEKPATETTTTAA